MRSLMITIMVTAVLLAGCGTNNEDFVKYSTDFYVQMFTDGDQTAEVNEMYTEYVRDFSKFKDDDLYEAVVGMYDGLANGNATKYQLEVMRIINE